MAIGKELGEFSLKITSTTFGAEGGAQLNLDGTATGYGTVLGTLSLQGEPGATSGSVSWIGQGYLDNGDSPTGGGSGTWEELGKHQWRVRMVVAVSDGSTHASDGRIDLASRSFTGKMLDWS